MPYYIELMPIVIVKPTRYHMFGLRYIGSSEIFFEIRDFVSTLGSLPTVGSGSDPEASLVEIKP